MNPPDERSVSEQPEGEGIYIAGDRTTTVGPEAAANDEYISGTPLELRLILLYQVIYRIYYFRLVASNEV